MAWRSDRARPGATLQPGGMRTTNRAPGPGSGSPRGWSRRGAPRSSGRSRAPAPCPRRLPRGLARTARTPCSRCSGAIPGPSSSTVSRAPGRTVTVTRPPAGECRMALSTRIPASWRRRASSPRTGAGSQVQRQAHADGGGHGLERLRCLGGGQGEVRVGRHDLDRVRIRAGEEQEVVHEQLHPRRAGVEVVQGPVHGRRIVAAASQLGDRGARDRERGPELVARVGGELALAPERLADRHQRAAGVDVAHRDRRREDGQAAAEQDDEQRAQGVHLRGPVADHHAPSPTRSRPGRPPP